MQRITINPEKQDNNDNVEPNKAIYYNDNSKEILDKMSRSTENLCHELSGDSIKFDKEHFIENVKRYIDNYNRILYSSITSYIFQMGDEDHTRFFTNIDSVREYVFGDEYKEKYLTCDRDKSDYEKIKLIVLKIWDHSNLADRQFNSFKKNNGYFEHLVKDQLKNTENKIIQSMNTQVISVVAIFTALAFIVFGGISSLSSIIATLASSSKIELIIAVTSIWGIALVDLIYMFIYLILKITKPEFNDKHIRHWIIGINIVLFILLTVSMFIYYVVYGQNTIKSIYEFAKGFSSTN